MSIHLGAKNGDFAETVLLPGDPKRAEFIATNYLTNPKRVNEVRNAWGYTGIYKGAPVSILGPGMGLSNINIYVKELAVEYGVKKFIRVGTCGAIQENIELGEIILAQGACTDSAMNTQRFPNCHYAPIADFSLLHAAHQKADKLLILVKVGNVFATDRFYHEEDEKWWKQWAKYGVLALEMESSELYTLAAHFKLRALSILTVSDNVANRQFMSPEQREKGPQLDAMIRLALELAL